VLSTPIRHEGRRCGRGGRRRDPGKIARSTSRKTWKHAVFEVGMIRRRQVPSFGGKLGCGSLWAEARLISEHMMRSVDRAPGGGPPGFLTALESLFC
jgi:hypothetical protein